MGNELMQNTLDQLNDEELIDLVQTEGNVHAFRQLYTRYSPIVTGLSSKITGDHTLGEEIAQETFWRVWHNAASFQPTRGTFTNWMFGIARNLSIDALRRYKKMPTRPFVLDTFDREEQHHEFNTLVAEESDVPQQVWASWQQEEILAALDELPPEQKDVIVWVYFQGRTRREIAQQEQIPFGTINTRARLALDKLRHILMGRGIEAYSE